MMKRLVVPLAGVALAAACGGDAPTAPGEAPDPELLRLAPAYHMSGTALARTGDGRTAECALDLIFELTERGERNREYVEYTGAHGGDVARAVTAADGSGFAFSAFVGGAITMRRYKSGAVEIRIPVNETTDVPFYREMALWEGDRTRGRDFEGSWSCGPLMLDEGGYRDLDITAEGTWRLTPQ